MKSIVYYCEQNRTDMTKTIIGVDPDVDKSGFCIVNSGKIQHLGVFPLWELFNYLDKQFDVLVVIEAGWIDKNGKEAKNKSYHGGGKGSSYDVGRNSEIGRQIAKFCQDNKIPYVLRQPRGYSGLNAAQFKAITKYEGKTNSETRVAAMFALDEWNLLNLQSKTK